MRIGLIIALAGAVVLHLAFVFAGELFIPHDGKKEARTHLIDLLGDLESKPDQDKEQPEEPKPEDPEELQAEKERPPDAAAMMRDLEVASLDSTPALEAASLSAIEAALNGQGGGGGDFAETLSFASGGRIGATGKPGATEQTLESAFSLAEIDQRPRSVLQGQPLYPAELRGKKVEGVVTIIFVVDADGRVLNPRVEKSSHPAFDQPALSAVKQWKFEPAVRGGQRVACNMRIPIRFQQS